jgi:MtrB/PioB family decaheme-associated outer membrane protein
MRTQKPNLVASAVALAVQSALAAMAVMPLAAMAQQDEPDVASLTNPTNTVEIGVGNNSKASDKFGEYTGLHKDGADLIGNFSVKGGDAYGQGSGTTRWSVTGTDLGTDSRNAGATYSDQGTWNVGIQYDQLRHYITDSYQTPYQGSMGSNTFTLPSNFGFISTNNNTNGGAGAGPNRYGTQVLNTTQQQDFQSQDIWSERKDSKFTAGVNLDRQWSFTFDYDHLAQSGAKLATVATDYIGSLSGANITNYKQYAAYKAGLGAGTGMVSGAQDIVPIMNPTDYTTNTFTFGLNWVGDKGHATGNYTYSKFNDNYNGVFFANPFVTSIKAAGTSYTALYPAAGTAQPMDALSTMPSNLFQQLNLNGGYAFSSTTKLVGGLSYGRNTQNDSYLVSDMIYGNLPQSSLNGLVVTKHLDLKLTDQTTKDLTLSAGLKFNERDNQTGSNLYAWNPPDPEAGFAAFNIPLSNKKTQFDLGGDYKISPTQSAHLGYEYEAIKRWCDNMPSGASMYLAMQNLATSSGGSIAALGLNGTFLTGLGLANTAAYFNAISSCDAVPSSTENRLVANYRNKVTEDVSVTAGYTFAVRKADLNTIYYTPMLGNSQVDAVGYVSFFDASRNEQVVKASANWQATQKLNFSLNGRYTRDDYTESTYGVQYGNTASINLDGTYSFTEKSSVSAYLTGQRRYMNQDSAGSSSINASSALTTVKPWGYNQSDNDLTIGLSGKYGELMGGRLGLNGDLTYSLGQSNYTTTIGYPITTAINNCTTPNSGGEICGTTPTIRNALTQLKLSGIYSLDKVSKVSAGVLFQHLNSNDYFYNGYQMGYTPATLIPTNQQSPSYAVTRVFASYIYSFK